MAKFAAVRMSDSDKLVYINLGNVTHFYLVGPDRTTFRFVGGDPNSVTVIGTPEDVFMSAHDY
jgi:hypothetical protein